MCVVVSCVCVVCIQTEKKQLSCAAFITEQRLDVGIVGIVFRYSHCRQCSAYASATATNAIWYAVACVPICAYDSVDTCIKHFAHRIIESFVTVERKKCGRHTTWLNYIFDICFLLCFLLLLLCLLTGGGLLSSSGLSKYSTHRVACVCNGCCRYPLCHLSFTIFGVRNWNS